MCIPHDKQKLSRIQLVALYGIDPTPQSNFLYPEIPWKPEVKVKKKEGEGGRGLNVPIGQAL